MELLAALSVGVAPVRVGADASEGISRASPRPARVRTRDGSGRLPMVVRGSCGLYRERARQGGSRVRAYRRRQNRRPGSHAIRCRFSCNNAVSLRRQRTRFDHLDYQSISRSAQRQTRVDRIRGDDRILERHGKESAASRHARAERGAIELRPRKRGSPAAHRSTLAHHHGGQKRTAVRREAAQVSDGDTRFAPRRAPQRRASHRRREPRRMRRQRAAPSSASTHRAGGRASTSVQRMVGGGSGLRGARPPRNCRGAAAEQSTSGYLCQRRPPAIAVPDRGRRQIPRRDRPTDRSRRNPGSVPMGPALLRREQR